MASVHEKLERVRKPRVHISYSVEEGDASVLRELPFVVGVMGDFSGDATKPLEPLKDRKFIQIDSENFDAVMARMSPGLNLAVDNTLAGNGTEMKIGLKFSSMDDFSPARVVQQVEPLRKLMETREKLRDLLVKSDRSENLEALLERVLQNSEELASLSKQLGVAPGGEPSKGE